MSADKTRARLEALMDLRVRARNLAEGHITPEDVEAYLKDLADDEEAAEWVDLPRIGPGDDDPKDPKTSDDA